ncbi:conjugal transfer protein TraD [Bartonella harrusi]|uniref:Conjugal transfer protein TraD n=1 Tax=Bartonella harrusi TaxID=2961895 RepID=A0ABY5EQH0_9HYPH|nr:conjugal transfer protein TraD [Bartonella harrusi]UTO27661.1 conjugal transfer protein TraD [Bartonella harrusi]
MKKNRIKVCAVISSTLNDAFIPGIQVALDSKEAESYGVFLETALSEEDAWDSCTTDPSETEIFDDMGGNHEF